MCVRVWVCLLQTVMEGKDEKLQSWRWGKDWTPGKQSDCGAWWMLLELSFLYLLSFSSPYLPSSRASVYFSKLSDGINQRGSLCMRAHALEMLSNVIYSFRTTACFNVGCWWLAFSWRRRETDADDGRPAASTHHSNWEVTKTYEHHGLHLWKKLKNKSDTFRTSLLMIYHKPMLLSNQVKSEFPISAKTTNKGTKIIVSLHAWSCFKFWFHYLSWTETNIDINNCK